MACQDLMIVIIINMKWCYTVQKACWRCGSITVWVFSGAIQKPDFPVTTDNVTGKVTELSHKISQYLRCIKTPYICFSKGGWSLSSHFGGSVCRTPICFMPVCCWIFSRSNHCLHIPSFRWPLWPSFRQEPLLWQWNPAVHISFHH